MSKVALIGSDDDNRVVIQDDGIHTLEYGNYIEYSDIIPTRDVHELQGVHDMHQIHTKQVSKIALSVSDD